MEKILSITAQKPHSTGSGTYLTEVVEALGRMEYEQAVIAGIYPSDEVLFSDNVKFYPVYFEEDFPIYGMSDVMPYPSSLYSTMGEADLERYTEMFTKVVTKAVEEFNPDIIFCHHLFLLAAIVKRLYPDKVVYGLCHGSDLRQIRTSNNLRPFIKEWIPKLDRIYSLHKEQACTISDIYGIDVNQIRIAGSGYNNCIFNANGRTSRAKSAPFRLLFAGKLSKAKGVMELLKACDELATDKDTPDFSLTLAGGCTDDDVRIAVENYQSKDYSNTACKGIDYIGMLSQKELAGIMRESDVFVLPSYFEGLGLVLIEAMACGLVPISTDLPGVQEWMNGAIKDNNVIYVPQPDMETDDKPYDYALPGYVADLKKCILQACNAVKEEAPPPDTSDVSWDGVAQNIFER